MGNRSRGCAGGGWGRGAAVVIAVMPLVLGGTLASWWSGQYRVARSELGDRVERMRTEGWPVDNESLAEFHRRMTDDTYTAQWQQILRTLESPTLTYMAGQLPFVGSSDSVPPAGTPWPLEDLADRFLASVDSELRTLHEIAASDRPVRFPIRFESVSTAMPHILGMRQVGRVLLLEHAVAARRADAAREFQALNALIGTAVALRGEPLLTSQIASISLHSLAIAPLKHSLERGRLSLAQIRTLIQRLQLFEDFDSYFLMGVAGERALALEMFEEPAAGGGVGPGEWVPGFAGSLDALAYLDATNRMEAVALADVTGFARAAADCEQDWACEAESAGTLHVFDTVWSQSHLPGHMACARALARDVMANRIALLGLGIAEYRMREGRLPAELDDLKAVGLDASRLRPLGDAPFGYRVERGQALLWGFDPAGLESGEGAVPTEPPVGTRAEVAWVWRLR